MKLRWWIVGAVAVVAGGMLVLRHFADNKEKLGEYADNKSGNNVDDYQPDVFESEFVGEDFLI
jgi:hypothetical protein